jgi:hypothetical protein
VRWRLPNDINLARRLAELRVHVGMSLADLADAIGVTKGTVWQYGAREDPHSRRTHQDDGSSDARSRAKYLPAAGKRKTNIRFRPTKYPVKVFISHGYRIRLEIIAALNKFFPDARLDDPVPAGS